MKRWEIRHPRSISDEFTAKLIAFIALVLPLFALYAPAVTAP
jgi:hypothetical protein